MGIEPAPCVTILVENQSRWAFRYLQRGDISAKGCINVYPIPIFCSTEIMLPNGNIAFRFFVFRVQIPVRYHDNIAPLPLGSTRC